MKKYIKDLDEAELTELYNSNEWLKNKLDSLAYEICADEQAEEYKLIGCDIFNYHNHYTSFYLTAPAAYGVADGYSVAHKLSPEYLNAENAKLYEELNALADKYENLTADELDEQGDELEDKMNEKAEALASGITEQLREYESADSFSFALEHLKEMILDGYNTIGELELVKSEDGKYKIIEVLEH